ncbi:hypothetical protein SRABI70_01488 [Pseudomonas sp. Bi70]|nr:hypothetical protein SRABI70_01488 [Pseudomonas sp. Bi70]
MGQGRDLLGRQANAHGQLQRILAGDGVIHQVAELRFVTGQARKEALPGACHDGIADQALFIEAIAEQFLRVIRVVVELVE